MVAIAQYLPKQTHAPDLSIDLCCGYGRHHSPKAKDNPKPYVTVSLNDIQQMLDNPLDVDKLKAPWVIPSTLPSRVHAEQRERGSFTHCGRTLTTQAGEVSRRFLAVLLRWCPAT